MRPDDLPPVVKSHDPVFNFEPLRYDITFEIKPSDFPATWNSEKENMLTDHWDTLLKEAWPVGKENVVSKSGEKYTRYAYALDTYSNASLWDRVEACEVISPVECHGYFILLTPLPRRTEKHDYIIDCMATLPVEQVLEYVETFSSRTFLNKDKHKPSMEEEDSFENHWKTEIVNGNLRAYDVAVNLLAFRHYGAFLNLLKNRGYSVSGVPKSWVFKMLQLDMPRYEIKKPLLRSETAESNYEVE